MLKILIQHNQAFVLKDQLLAQAESKDSEFVVESITMQSNLRIFASLARLDVKSGSSSCPIRAHVDEKQVISSIDKSQSFILKPSFHLYNQQMPNQSLSKNAKIENIFLPLYLILYQIIKIQMSILSKQQFDKLCITLQSIQEQLLQQSKNLQNKIMLAHARIDLISQQVDKQNQKNLHEGADRLLKIHQQIENVQANANKLNNKYVHMWIMQKQQVSSMKQQVNKQIQILQQNVNLSKEARTKEIREIQRKLQLQVQRIQQQSQKQNQRQIQQILSLQIQLIKELSSCSEELLANRNKIMEDENKLCEKFNKISQDLQLKIKQLTRLRRQKKGNFLQLLEKVIIKIRQSQTFQI